VWRIGFVTQSDATAFGLTDYVTVYLPHSYAFSGILYFVKKDRVRLLDGVSSADVMKFAISGGVADFAEHTTVEEDSSVKG
jgi:hypothetical protein